MNEHKSKTVYILGAGFSYPAGIPTQKELLVEIINYKKFICCDMDPNRDKVIKYIFEVFGLDSEQAKKLDLEDIYTPIHQSISKNEYLKNYSPDKLRDVEESLNYLVSTAIELGKGGRVKSKEYVSSFIDQITQHKRTNTKNDSVSIFTTNWDILLDKTLFEKNELVVDYCCHHTGLDGDNKNIPALVAIERNIPTIKLLKLHGSLNWIMCPKCERLFIHKQVKISIQAFLEDTECNHCKQDGYNIKLQSILGLPSFQKDLDSFHLKHIWNQAKVELSEATKLVFIGYSFPLADFEFRSLLTKHSRDEVVVDVVTYSKEIVSNEEINRYRNYFGNKLHKIYNKGVEEYVKGDEGISAKDIL